MHFQSEENLQGSVRLASSLTLDRAQVAYQPQPEALELFVELIGLHSFGQFEGEAVLFSVRKSQQTTRTRSVTDFISII